MNTRRSVLCLLLGLLLSLAALSCRQQQTVQSEPTETPVMTAEPTQEPEQPDAFTAPEEGCAIAFPDRPLYHYDMDLTLDEAAHTVGGHVTFTFYNDSETPWDRLCLRDYPSLFTDPEAVGYDGSMELSGAQSEIVNLTDGRDGSALSYERDEDVSVVWLTLKNPLAPNEWMTLSYVFSATIPLVADRFGYEAGVYNVTNFYPILAEYADGDWSHAAFYGDGECFCSEIADYDVKLTLPAGYTVAATGTETGKTGTDDAVTYTLHAPCVRDFVFSASASFVWADTSVDGVRVNVLYSAESQPVPDMSAPVEAALCAAADSLTAFGKAFGKYPYAELDVVLAPIYAGGMEYPNLVLIADALCDPSSGTDASESKPYSRLQNCVAHEIGHQWFMGIVGSNSGMQPWQDESFASYAELVYSEFLGGLDGDQKEQIRFWNLSDAAKLKKLKSSLCYPINRAYYDFATSTLYQRTVYWLGQAVLYRMEELLGEREFHAVLREYVRRNAFTNADPDSFFDVLYAYAGTDNAALNELIDSVFDR